MLSRLAETVCAAVCRLLVATWATIAFGDQPIPIEAISTATVVDYANEIAPMLRANCLSCHNRTTSRGELNLETVAHMVKGGDSGPAIVTGKGSESLLLRTAAHLDDPCMPPKENKVKAANLTPKQLGLLQLWIDQGAKSDRQDQTKIAWEMSAPAVTSIFATAISPDGQYIACSRGSTIDIYHLPTRQLVAQLIDESLVSDTKNARIAHRDLIPALAFSPDGMRIASGSHREIKIWQRLDHLDVQEVSGSLNSSTAESKVLTKQAESLDGKRLVSIEGNSGVQLRDKVSGSLVAELRGDQRKNTAAAKATRYAEFLVSEANFRKQEVKRIEEEVKRLAERAKTMGNDLATFEKTLASKESEHHSASQAIQTELDKVRSIYRELEPKGLDYKAPDEKTKKQRSDAEEKLAATSKVLRELESAIPPMRAMVAQLRSELALANERVEKKKHEAIEASTVVAAADAEKEQANRDASAAKVAATAEDRATTAACFSPDSTQLATATDDGKLHIWSAVDGSAIAVIDAQDSTRAKVAQITWPDQAIVASMEDGRRWEYRRSNRWLLAQSIGGDDSPLHDRVSALRFTNDGTLLAAGSGEFSRNGELTLWRATNGTLIHVVPELHRDSILSLAFSRDGKRLATGSSDRTMKVLKTENWQVEKSFEGHTSHVLSVDWKADGRTLASAGADHVVKIWDYASGDRIRNMENWDSEVTTAEFVGYTGNLLVSSGGQSIKLLDESGTTLRSFSMPQDYIQTAAASENGSVIIGGGYNGVLYVWDGQSGQLLAEFALP